jgi:energy-coupling factor transporter ATP-binding protein EcfA2
VAATRRAPADATRRGDPEQTPERPRAIRRSDRLLIVGTTGCGKTELAKMIAAGHSASRLIVWDAKDELQLGVAPARGVGALEQRLRRGGRIVHWVPLTGEREEYEEAAALVWRTPGPYLWWVDEAAECTSKNWVPRGLRLCATQGRASERTIMALTQRVAECHVVLRSLADHIIVFCEEPIEVDLKALAGHVGLSSDELRRLLGELHADFGRHAHLWSVRPTRELRRCAPIPLRQAPPAGAPARRGAA